MGNYAPPLHSWFVFSDCFIDVQCTVPLTFHCFLLYFTIDVYGFLYFSYVFIISHYAYISDVQFH